MKPATGDATRGACVVLKDGRVIEIRHGRVEVRDDDGLHVTFPAVLTPQARALFDERERLAALGALTAFLSPRSVAVVGASGRETIGGELLHNLVAREFAGPVYAVNPRHEVVQSMPAFRSVMEIPGPVDLAAVVVPAAQVVDVARDCARKGVRSLLVISAGFGETDDAGRGRQAELLSVCRAAGMRLVGPNCMGVINTDPAVRLDATFGPEPAHEGHVGFFSQSGALGLAIIDQANALGIGISTFVSAGNKADVSGNDLLSYWESDPRTSVILMYLESFGNPRKFSRIARRVGRQKPIVVLKSGRSQAGARASSSHTGALLAASDVTVDALLLQCGVIRTNTLDELFDVGALLASQPFPTGRRVAIVTNAGGPGILCADTCEAEGLEVPLLAEATQAALRDVVPVHASVTNPVDMTAGATGDQYERALALAAADPGVDAIIAIYIPPLPHRAPEVVSAIVTAVRNIAGAKPVIGVFMSWRGVPAELRAGGIRIPSYTSPEPAARALARVARYGEWRSRPAAEPPVFDDLRREEAAAIVAGALGRGGGWLGPDACQALLACYGLPVAGGQLVKGAAAVGRAADALAGPVVVKAVAPGLIHKTDAGGVRLGVEGGTAARQAAEEMSERLGAQGTPLEGFLVQPMAAPGVEMIVGVVVDPQFGPVVACGLGGVLVELLRDVSVRLTPLGSEDAREMVRSLRAFPLLAGFRGRPASDVGALEDAIARVSAMVEDLPEIVELDCNPILVHERGATIVDARIRAEKPPAGFTHRRPPLGLRGERACASRIA